MEQRNLWRKWSSTIFWSIVVLTLSGWITGLMGIIQNVVQIILQIANNILGNYLFGVNRMAKFESLADDCSTIFNIFSFLTFASWVPYLIGVYKFRYGQNSINAMIYVGKVNGACWLGIIAAGIAMFAGWTPWFIRWVFTFIGWIFSLISYFKFRSAFRNLETEQTWNKNAQHGANLLRKSANYNIWLLFMPIIAAVVGVGILLFSIANLKASFDGANSADSVMWKVLANFTMAGVFVGLPTLILSFLQFFYRIYGWYCIKNGEPIVDENINVPVEVVPEAVATHDISNEDNESKSNSNKKNIWKIGGISAVAITVLITVFVLLGGGGSNDDMIGKKYVYTDATPMYRLVDGKLGEDPVKTLEFGDELTALEADSLWCKVSINGDEGYVATTDVMDWVDFSPLNKAFKESPEIRLNASKRNYRRAVAEEMKLSNSISIKELRWDSPSNGYHDYIGIVTFDTATDMREYSLYGFKEDIGMPIKLHHEVFPKGMSEIKEVTYRSGEYKVTYQHNDTQTQMLDGANVFVGYVYDKNIVMNLTRDGNSFTGIYRYSDNEGHIELSGELGEDGVLTLAESVNGRETGQFIGQYSDTEYSGYWLSADGERSLPFKVHP